LAKQRASFFVAMLVLNQLKEQKLADEKPLQKSKAHWKKQAKKATPRNSALAWFGSFYCTSNTSPSFGSLLWKGSRNK
jgi:hypothetical protein